MAGSRGQRLLCGREQLQLLFSEHQSCFASAAVASAREVQAPPAQTNKRDPCADRLRSFKVAHADSLALGANARAALSTTTVIAARSLRCWATLFSIRVISCHHHLPIYPRLTPHAVSHSGK